MVDREVCWNVFVCRTAAAGCGETQKEHCLGLNEIHEFDDSGMTMKMEQVVTQLQRDVVTWTC